MIVIPGPIPIAIHPFFWLVAALIGWLYSQSLMGMLIWIGIVFFSVLFHEYGHAITAVFFKQKARIQLVAMGGVTSYEGGPKLKFWQQFIIVFNGPLFGIFIFLFATLTLQADLRGHPIFYATMKWTQLANLFWSIVNLLPIMPLDGGQLLRIALEGFFGVKGFKAALLVGAIIAVFLCFYFILLQAFLIGAIFFLFAFQSFDSWRRVRYATGSDRDEDNKKLMMEAEIALQEGRKSDAINILEDVRKKTEGGVLAFAASQYLAFLYVEHGKHKEAYDLLLPIKQHISDDALCLLHKLSSEFNNPDMVAELSKTCFQSMPSQEMALRSARAFAVLKKGKMAGGWLESAFEYGGLDLDKILQEPAFVQVKDDPDFKHFVEQLKR